MFDRLATARKASMRSLFNRLLSDGEIGTEIIATFERVARKFSCLDNQILFHKGDPSRLVYLVKAGEVDLILFLSSTRAIGFRAKAGSLVGLPAAFSNEPYSMTAVTYRGAELGVMDRERFCNLVATSSQLSLEVLRTLAAETSAARIPISYAAMERRKSRSGRLKAGSKARN